MSYEYDSGFGDVAGSESWQYVLVPRAILSRSKYGYNGNQVIEPGQFFSKSFFTIPAIVSDYGINVISLWLKSIGIDPGLYMMNAEDGRLAIDGKKVGLCFWPPAFFRNQQHLDAWLFYWKTFRRLILGRTCMYNWEVGGIPPSSTSADNGIARLRRQTLDGWGGIIDSEWDALVESTASAGGSIENRFDFQYEYKIPQLYYTDPELQAKVMVLYTLGCAHMAYAVFNFFPEITGLTQDQLSQIGHCRQSPDHPVFPGAADLPYYIDTGPSFAEGLLGLLSAGAVGIATGGVVGGALATATNFARAASQGSRSPSFVGVSVPSNSTWTMVPVPLEEVVESSRLTLPIAVINTALVQKVLAPTLAQKALSTMQTAVWKGSPATIIKLAEQKQSSLLLPALGIGGLLLLMKLLKK